ncbi:MAG: S-layer homology domain-containing protein [Clostridia bacterium]
MKNIRRIVALALSFALTLALFAGAAFSDQDAIGADYKDDVNMLVELGVLGGYPDGTFKPEGTITRAEFTKMAYVLKYGSDDQGQIFAKQESVFTDVKNDASLNWARGYINYCSNQKIVGGLGNNKFNPGGNVTAAEAAKMLLVILGCDPEKEGLGGPNWQANTIAKAMELGILDGWVGNPSQAATRQLVAKLMRNTIFAPIYIYNPITRAGSQLNPMDPTKKNETLGEKTMGLKSVTGIVVSNENYAINRDEFGKVFGCASQINCTKDKSQVVYEYNNESGANSKKVLTIDRALDDNMLGSLVDVYFRADGKDGVYANVRVIGNIVVNAKTVTHEVSSSDIKLMPNEKDDSNGKMIQPYIVFRANGEEKKIQSQAEVKKVAGGTHYNGAAFADMSFFSDSTSRELVRGLLRQPSSQAGAVNPMFDNMGKDAINSYRLVSIDGGSTYCYIIQFRAGKKAISLGNVTSYSTANKSISISGAGTYSLDEVNVYDGIAARDDVIVFIHNGKPTLKKVETISGKVTKVTVDGIATINDQEYRADMNIFGDNLSNYFSNNHNAINENTTFKVLDGFVLATDTATINSSSGEYAVVLASLYDKDLGVAKVRLGFADNTEGTYEVSRFFVLNENDKEYAAQFANNAKFAYIYKYSITDGRVDLSGERGQPTVPGQTGDYKVQAQKFTVNGTSYLGNESSVMFMLYGDLLNPVEGKRTQVKAKAYKMKDMPLKASKGIPGIMINNSLAEYPIANVKMNNNPGSVSTFIVGVMTTGEKAPVLISDTDGIAYLVSAKQAYNVASGKWYVSTKMINEQGVFELDTIDDVTNGEGVSLVSTPKANATPNGYDRGSIARYRVDGDSGKIQTIDTEGGRAVDMKRPIDIESSGLYYATLAGTSGKLLGFYTYSDANIELEPQTGKLPRVSDTILLNDEYKVIGISGGSYSGEDINFITRDSMIPGKSANAIIQIKEGKIVKIFSFDEQIMVG